MNYILILNFNTFNAHTIAKLLRNNSIYTIIKNGNTPIDQALLVNCRGIIICGDYAGSLSGLELDKAWLATDLPILALGSCAIAVNNMLGGKASDSLVSNDIEDIHYYDNDYSVLKQHTHALIQAKELFPADNVQAFAYIKNNICIDVKHITKQIFCIQRNFERNDPYSIELIRGFAIDICHCPSDWDIEQFLNDKIAEVKSKFTNKHAVCAVSGGLDSAVCSYIFKQALGENVKCIFIDTGFFRKNEEKEIVDFYKNIIKLDIEYIDAKNEFFEAIKEITDNLNKIRIVRNLISNKVVSAISNPENTVLVSGANYNDMLFQSIQQNDNKNSEHIKCELFYPLENIFKFEIKLIAQKLNLPDSIYRKPFSSAGLATSIIGKVTQERLKMIKHIYEIYSNELLASNIEKKISNYSAKLLPFSTMENKYEVHIRAIQDTQNIIAYAYRMPFDLLERVTENILKEYPNIVRHVLYETTPYETSSAYDLR